MSDAELADALERLLWIGDPDPKCDNETNLIHVATMLEEHATLLSTLQTLIHILVPNGGWRESQALAQALLEALAVVWERVEFT